ncbi:aminotransferase-like domain-containing protein [Pseudomonas sp. PSKL.D1]|uniref:aminotransferase-like domain-containing protein n=1 Tax=Pseudomonas sp. PSKL.D1 TaxID=3029060 RepID=UPI0023810A42|nr:PLP-dependent aminotransferase family protein [Pseudomonas sp. PSKL.D1]WDY55756.1 PLP-dependent aminotransferase family protein [Pseudomonas sp. PSKL.D1]
MGRQFAYQAVYHYLEGLIEGAQYGGEVRLPSLRALAKSLRVSLATVQTAYGLLEHEGRVRSVPKSGYFAQIQGRPVGGDQTALSHAPTAQSALQQSLLAHERRLARHRSRTASRQECASGARLRTVLAERYTQSSRYCWRPEDVHVAPDVQALLELLVTALGLQGGAALVASPCCWRVLRALQSHGMRVFEIPFDHDGSPDIASLARLLAREPVRIVVMPSCLSMPAGRLMPRHAQQQVAQLLGRYAVWLVENDLDSEHCHVAPPGTRLRDWVDPQWLLVMGSLEVALGAEAPYAYVLGTQETLVDAFTQRAFQIAPLRQQALAQMLAKGEIDEHLVRARWERRGRMAQLCTMLARHLGKQVVLVMPEGGNSVWVRLLQPVDCDRLATLMAGSALQAVAGTRFSLQRHYRQYLALTWVSDDPHSLREAIERLAQALGGRRGRQLAVEG